MLKEQMLPTQETLTMQNPQTLQWCARLLRQTLHVMQYCKVSIRNTHTHMMESCVVKDLRDTDQQTS